jgi:hypothetical protein
MLYDFDQKLAASKGERSATDAATIKQLLDGCVSVAAAETELDKKGVDFVATLRGGAQVMVDVKSRVSGCSRYWKNGQPELAIEKWSVMPGGRFNERFPKAGWTLDEAKVTDMILYVFPPEDCTTAFLLPFQSLRMAARRNIEAWMRTHKVDTQTSNRWQSQAVFVPADEVLTALASTYSARA